MISFQKLGITTAVLITLPFAAYAQTGTASTTPTAVATIFADIRLVNVRAVEKDGVISGEYALEGKMGKQNDINVGVIAYDKNYEILNAAVLKTGLSVQQGELAAYSFSYTIPAYLSGDITFALEAETASGLPLGVAPLGTKTLSGAGRTVACRLTDISKAVISCSATVDTSVTVSYAPGSLFAMTTSSEKKEIKKGQQISFTPALPSGRYVAHVATAKNGEESVIKFKTPGSYGAITSIIANSFTPGAVHVVALVDTTEKDTSLTLGLTSSLGTPCGTVTKSVMGGVVELTMQTSCKEGTIHVDLVGPSGGKLASKSEPFSTIVVTPKNTKGETSESSTIPMLFGLLLLVALTALFAYRTSIKSIFGVILLLALFSVGTHHAQAFSYQITFYCTGGSACPLATTIFGTVQPDSSTYTPGQAIYLNGSLTSDDNPQYFDNTCGQVPCVAPIARGAIDTTASGYGPDIYPGNYTQQQMRNQVYSASTFLGNAPSTSGTHTIFYTAAAAGYSTMTGSDAISVNPITVDVYFQ